MTISGKTIGFWEVSGSFLIPGTREKGSFGPVKVIGASKQEASRETLAPMLNRQFAKELSNRSTPSHLAYKFSGDWALMNLRWIDKMGKRAQPVSETPPVTATT